MDEEGKYVSGEMVPDKPKTLEKCVDGVEAAPSQGGPWPTLDADMENLRELREKNAATVARECRVCPRD
jgi:hypothetical protein